MNALNVSIGIGLDWNLMVNQEYIRVVRVGSMGLFLNLNISHHGHKIRSDKWYII